MECFIQSRQVRVNGLDIHYLTGGQGHPLLVIHGGGGGTNSWKANLQKLAKKYTVFAPDMPGFGMSQAVERDFFIHEMVDFVDMFAKHVGLQKFHLLGHSFGGAIALNYSLRFPFKVTKLVLVSSMFLGREVAIWVWLFTRKLVLQPAGWLVLNVLRFLKWFRYKSSRNTHYEEASITKASINIGKCVTTLKDQATIMTKKLPGLLIPTLLVWGEKDRIVPCKHAHQASKIIPDCRVKIFRGVGHSIYRDKLEEFSMVIGKFLG